MENNVNESKSVVIFASPKSLKDLAKLFPDKIEEANEEILKHCEDYSKYTPKELEEVFNFAKGAKTQSLNSVEFAVRLIDERSFFDKDAPRKKLEEEQEEKKEARIRSFLKEDRENYKPSFELVFAEDLKDYEPPNQSWIVKDLIPFGITIHTGKRASMKSFKELNLAFSLANGLPFLGKYETQKSRVLYLDKENGWNIMQQRVNMVTKGLGVEPKDDVGFICFSQLKLDRLGDLEALEEIIKKFKIDLLIVDTYRRAISFDENSAGDVSDLFVDFLRPFVERNGVSIILIHHDKKGDHKGDEMDKLRGSSDLANYADCIIKSEKKGNQLLLKQLKCRNAPEIKPIEVLVETDKKEFIKFNGSEHIEYNAERKAEEVILTWLRDKSVGFEFKTKEAKEVAFQKGIKQATFENTLKALSSDETYIKKISKGNYKLIQEVSEQFTFL